MDRPAISVIVPTHNGADRIRRLLDSIVVQSFKDYELLVVCDRCTDGTADVAREYGAKVIEGDFGSDGLTRNAGLDAANGEWILFADDDDWYLHECCFQQIAAVVGRHGEDVLDFGFIVHGDRYYRQKPEECYTMVWSRAWKRDFFSDRRFGDEEYGSDTAFYKRHVQGNPDIRVAMWDMPIYCYNHMREGSMTWAKNRER